MALNWQKILPLLLQLLTLLFGGAAIANGTAITYGGESADTTLTQLLTWGGGAGAIVTAIWGQWATWRSGQGITASRGAEIAALGVLTATSSARGDDHAMQMLGQLSKHLAKPNAPKPAASTDDQPRTWRPVTEILQELTNTIAHQNAVTIEATTPRL